MKSSTLCFTGTRSRTFGWIRLTTCPDESTTPQPRVGSQIRPPLTSAE